MQRAARTRLRRWQHEALLRFETSDQGDFLAVATPGAGKTTFALAAAVRALQARRVHRVIVVAPTQHLKHQWAMAARAFGVTLEPEWSSQEGRLPRDLHGAVVTYQQVAANPQALRGLGRDALAVLDEIHHAAESRAWGDAIRLALGGARYRLSLSGTPFRTDQNPIPFIRYRAGDAEPDYEYGYAEALADRRVVRPVYFPRIGGHMEWTAPDGTSYAQSFDDRLTRELASQRLRAALSIEHEWLPAVLAQAHAKLAELRASDARAGGMVIAMDQDHARAIARLLRDRFRVTAALATSDDPEASAKIAAFARGDSPWIVAVRMVSEGVDIPRLRVGVYATHTITELFFRQAVGRLVRWSAGGSAQAGYMYIPDDLRIRTFAEQIQKERRHSLNRRSERDDDLRAAAEEESAEAAEEAEQLSLFSVISAVPTHAVVPATAASASEPAEASASEGTEETPSGDTLELPLLAQEPTALALVAPELPGRADANPGEELYVAPLAASSKAGAGRRELRTLNTERVQQIARRAGMDHAAVNATLNRAAGIQRISEATRTQLERRIQLADAWLRKLGS